MERWWIADPANPDRRPTEVAYPAAGTDNALVTLHVLALDGGSVEVEWDHVRFPYLAAVRWTSDDRLLLSVQSRDQCELLVLVADPTNGTTHTASSDADEHWVELVDGVPAELGDGRLVTAAERDGARRLLVAGEPVTPHDLQVRGVIAVDDDRVTFLAHPLDDATVQHVWRWTADDASLSQLTNGDGVHSASVGGPTTVVRTSTLDATAPRTAVLGGPELTSHREHPLVEPNVRLFQLGERKIATAVLLPHDVQPGARLPVLLDPYGGPGAQRVVASRSAYLSSQWFADQGFAVVIADGRGTPGRGSDWERAIHLDLASAVLEDQVDALRAAAEQVPELDLTRVAIRGWSFGGYLAALAVLRRPDVFHAAIAGAPVTEWRLYDTHYTERYLGDPTIDAEPYERSSLLVDAPSLERPLLLIHGLADDNVVSAHTLQLSTALLAAGRAHRVLPLSGVSHMTPQEVVAENLLLFQLEFLREVL